MRRAQTMSWDEIHARLDQHEHDGGRAVTHEQLLRRYMAKKNLVPSESDYAAAGVEVIGNTSRLYQR